MADEGAPLSPSQQEAAGAQQQPLPKCFCNWKHCRTYQKTFREYKHPIFNGVIKLKFSRTNPKSMALKASVERTLHVAPEKRNEWRTDESGDEHVRYYVARHHFTSTLLEEYLQDRRAWDWNEPLDLKRAKKYLWSLDRHDIYEEDGQDEDDVFYVQAPNVPKDQVKDTLRALKAEIQAKQEQEAAEKAAAAAAAAAASDPEKVEEPSATTQTTLSSSVTDTLRAFENNAVSDEGQLLVQKEQENVRLRQELNDCQEQLSMLHSMVRQLKDDMDNKTRGKKKSKKKSRYEESESEEEDEDSEESSEEESSDDEEWSQNRHHGKSDDDDETVSTFQVNQGMNRSSHSRRSVRKNSIHSRRSMVSQHRRNSVHSRHGASAHSRVNSIHSRRSMRGGANDDAMSVHSRQSLASVSPSIKSLPREIELMDEDEETTNKDDYSFFDDSYRRPDDDAKSVGSRSAASRRSIVRDQRSRGHRASGAGRPPKKKGGKAPAANGSVPREIDLSGDELEDETYANVSTDTQFVTEKQIVDPYGEKGVYTGALSKSTGMPNGKGRLEYEKEGRWYEGDWIHGRWTGYGRLSNGDGDFYEGGLKNDHKHGTGVMKFADGRVFEGEYIRGQMIQGKMTYQDGSIYGGSWVDGMRHGRGKCVFVDGSEYEGEFREGNFHGHGKMTWNDGGWYVGEWCDGEMHGRGKEIRPDGTLRHDGEWSRGQPIRNSNGARRSRNSGQVEVS